MGLNKNAQNIFFFKSYIIYLSLHRYTCLCFNLSLKIPIKWFEIRQNVKTIEVSIICDGLVNIHASNDFVKQINSSPMFFFFFLYTWSVKLQHKNTTFHKVSTEKNIRQVLGIHFPHSTGLTALLIIACKLYNVPFNVFLFFFYFHIYSFSLAQIAFYFVIPFHQPTPSVANYLFTWIKLLCWIFRI